MDLNITKQGIFSATTFIEYHQEPDGTLWIPIGHHNNPVAKKFSSSNDFGNGVYLDSDRWLNAGVLNSLTSWEMLWIQRAEATSAAVKFRWVQNYNPLTATYAQVAPGQVTFNTSSGYTSSSYGGMYKLNSNTYLCCANNSNGNWFGALGAWNAHDGGIPGFPGASTVRTGCIDAYVRVPEATLKVLKMGGVEVDTFYEI